LREREREKAYERTYQRERESERDQKRRVRVSERRVCVREKRVCQRRVCKVGFLFRVSRVSNSKLSLSPIVRVTWSHALALDCIRDILCIQFERICPLQNTFECRAEKGTTIFHQIFKLDTPRVVPAYPFLSNDLTPKHYH